MCLFDSVCLLTTVFFVPRAMPDTYLVLYKYLLEINRGVKQENSNISKSALK